MAPDRPDTRPLIPVLLGPTGAGKTALLESLLASPTGSVADIPPVEIVSCDSRQIYRELEIGSAAPEPKLLARLPHYLVGVLQPTETYSAARFRGDALAAIADILARGRLPLIAGGSGFYFRALQTGLFALDVSAGRQAGIRRQVQELGAGERLRRLRELDPAAVLSDPAEQARAGRVHPNDDYRVTRALEIVLASGRAYSEIWAESRRRSEQGGANAANPYRFTGWRLEVDRESYWRGLAGRARAMVASGIIEEAGRVFERYGVCPGLETLGYSDALAAWRGELGRDELAERLYISHRQYGKRQRTWLRREDSLTPESRDGLARDFPGALAARLRNPDGD
ncbi:MAG: tRNA (adenosine(37)-N6)-dimethylallyltransferase MiaA [Leptospirales bacterium]|jgi:tRNA dimethylallyltransferase